MNSRPIGVFDSGMGGLTVLHECLVTMPHEDFVYLGDGARLPYGPRPLDEVRRFSLEIAGYLAAQGVKLILVACNSATSAALPDLQERISVPVVGVITPEAHAAVQVTRNRRIGLMATEATVTAGRYAELVHTLDAGTRFFPLACPELVPLIEGPEPFGAETTAAVRRRAAEGGRGGHGDPRLHALPADPADLPARLRARRDARLLGGGDRPRGGRDAEPEGDRERPKREGGYRFLTTGDIDRFKELGQRFLQLPLDEVDRVEIAELEAAARELAHVPGAGLAKEASARRAGQCNTARTSAAGAAASAVSLRRSPAQPGGSRRRPGRESDGRRADELRPLEIEVDYLEQPAGSALISAGKTRVLCTASITEGVPRWLMGKGKGWMTAEYGLLPASTGERTAREASSGRQKGRTVEIQRLIGRSLRAVTDLDALGERTLWIDCDVLQADGGTRCAAISGAYVASRRALDRFGLGKALTDSVAGVSLGIVDGEALLDLDYSEDSRAEVDLNVVMSGDGRLIEVQATAEGERYTREQLDDLLDLAAAGIEQIGEAQQRAVEAVLA